MEIDKVNKAAILLEALEIFINHILYLRDLYPQKIFQKRRAYNTPVFISIFPGLNDYLSKVLKTIKDLLMKNEDNDLQSIELVFYKNQDEAVESYSFDIIGDTRATQATSRNNKDEFLLQFEEKLRASLYMLSERLKPLKKLPPDTKFKILLHTTQTAFIQLTQNPHNQDFPWLQNSEMEQNDLRKEISILPLSSLDDLGIQILAHIRN